MAKIFKWNIFGGRAPEEENSSSCSAGMMDIMTAGVPLLSEVFDRVRALEKKMMTVGEAGRDAVQSVFPMTLEVLERAASISGSKRLYINKYENMSLGFYRSSSFSVPWKNDYFPKKKKSENHLYTFGNVYVFLRPLNDADREKIKKAGYAVE